MQAEVQACSAEAEARAAAAHVGNAEGARARGADAASLVRPGERLFIVKGIDAWRRAQHSAK